MAGVTYPGLAAKTQALLFYLGMTRRPHLRTALAALLWADMPERDARGNLRKAIQQLQEKFGDYLTVDHHSLGLRADAPCWVDAVEFLSVAGDGPGGSGPGDAASNCRRAVQLYGGEFLAGFYVRNAPEFEAWMLAEKDRLRETLLHCLETLAGHAVAQNDIQQAIAFTRRIVEIEPWREDAQRRLMELLAESGQRAAALKQYEICRQVLLEEARRRARSGHTGALRPVAAPGDGRCCAGSPALPHDDRLRVGGPARGAAEAARDLARTDRAALRLDCG